MDEISLGRPYLIVRDVGVCSSTSTEKLLRTKQCFHHDR